MKNRLDWKVANLQANKDRLHETPEQKKERKQLLKKLSRHIKNFKK